MVQESMCPQMEASSFSVNGLCVPARMVPFVEYTCKCHPVHALAVCVVLEASKPCAAWVVCLCRLYFKDA